MAVSEVERRWIDRFQENLSIVRKVAGWTTQELADEVGVTRQTIWNLEHGRTPMSKLQYLALRTVFNVEIAEHDNHDLARVITTLVDDPLRPVQEEQAEGGASGDDAAGEVTPVMRGPASAVVPAAGEGKAHADPGAAMRILAVVTGALASGAAAGALAFLMFPDGGRR
ncbi:helix-turn-helix transcriptional regulator [Bifidobacterium sp. CP2]|uniref:helix-turn-helix domain-containing protein n=1 Tax=Bifidobacterium sp. CP2 TaxID=2809025 RepID=UPI001BDBFA50|nr:helix-turn-helix transcriptional regulator [Bifidobacterium sp. CP2]MBT1181896.1 helix-turn-helix transcriptional regulator [Bifidobacterium sp. CP2]